MTQIVIGSNALAYLLFESQFDAGYSVTHVGHAAISSWLDASRRNYSFKGALKRLSSFIGAQLPSSFNKLLGLSYVLCLRDFLLFFSCFSHTASQ